MWGCVVVCAEFCGATFGVGVVKGGYLMGNLVLHDEVMVHSASFHLAYEWRVFLFSVPAVAGVGQGARRLAQWSADTRHTKRGSVR